MRARSTPSGVVYGMVGAGPPMLFLSGYLAPIPALQAYVAQFAERYTCIVFDARGSGRTPASCFPQTTAGMALDALEVLRECGYESAHVHGISLGGMVAQELAIRAPHRVRTLVLGATTSGGLAATPPTLRAMLAHVEQVQLRLGPVHWRGAFNQAWAASRHDAGARLGRVQAPCLVVHGADDALLPPANASVLASLVPRAELVQLADVGHLYPLEEPLVTARTTLSRLERLGDPPPAQPAPSTLAARDLAMAPLRRAQAEVVVWRHAYRAVRPAEEPRRDRRASV